MGGAVFPPSLFDLRPNYGGGNEDNGDLLQKVLCRHCLIQCPQPCSRPPLTHASTRDSWTLTGKSGSVSCGVTALLLGPSVHKVLFVSSKSLFPQSNISSSSSVVGLMATSSKRAYVIPSSAAPRAPAPVAAHCWPLPPQETLQHSSSSVSVGCLAVILPVAIFKTYFSYNHISPRTFMPLNTIILISQK